MAGLKCCQEDPRQLTHLGCMSEIGLHEVFDGPAVFAIGIAHALGHLDLHVEGQLILRPIGDQMQMAAD